MGALDQEFEEMHRWIQCVFCAGKMAQFQVKHQSLIRVLLWLALRQNLENRRRTERGSKERLPLMPKDRAGQIV